MFKMPKWTKRAMFLRITLCAVLLASLYSAGEVSGGPLRVATAPGMGTAGSFAVLGASTVTNTGASVVEGNLGVSPGSAVTGFPPGVLVNGVLYAGNAVAAQAQTDARAANDNLGGQACDFNLSGQDLGGKTLIPGVYCFDSSAQLTGNLTLDFQNSANAVFVFKIASTLTTASNASVGMINGANVCHTFWKVGSSVTLGTGSRLLGITIASASISMNNGASLTGSAIALNGAVTMDNNNVSNRPCYHGATATATIPSGATATATVGAPTATATVGGPAATATATVGAPTATATQAIPTATRTAIIGVPTATRTLIPAVPTATPIPQGPTPTPVPQAATPIPQAATATPAPATPAPTATTVVAAKLPGTGAPPTNDMVSLVLAGAGAALIALSMILKKRQQPK